jgi:hypothetical protein
MGIGWRLLGPLTGIGAMLLAFAAGLVEPTGSLSPESPAETIARELHETRSSTRAFVHVAGPEPFCSWSSSRICTRG